MIKPYYDEGGQTIYHGDCLEILPELGEVDLVLTDLPYGIGVKYGTFEDNQQGLKKLICDVMPKILTIGKRTVLTCGHTNMWHYPPADWVMAWLNMAGSSSSSWGFTCWRPILCYGKDPYLQEGLGRRHDVIESMGASEKNSHPCPKPIRFWKKLLLRASIRNSDVVLDPFLGSGTTLVACQELGRRGIGIEISEAYCEIAVKRLRQQILPGIHK